MRKIRWSNSLRSSRTTMEIRSTVSRTCRTFTESMYQVQNGTCFAYVEWIRKRWSGVFCDAFCVSGFRFAISTLWHVFCHQQLMIRPHRFRCNNGTPWTMSTLRPQIKSERNVEDDLDAVHCRLNAVICHQFFIRFKDEFSHEDLIDWLLLSTNQC